MPRKVEHYRQPKLGLTAGDLGTEAYQANLADEPGPDDSYTAGQAGIVPSWKRPEPRNSPPGQYRNHDRQEIKMGQDWKIHSDHGASGT